MHINQMYSRTLYAHAVYFYRAKQYKKHKTSLFIARNTIGLPKVHIKLDKMGILAASDFAAISK